MNDAPLYSPFLIVPFQYPDVFQNDTQIGCPLRMSYVSGSSPEDCDAKPVNLGPLPEFLNIICQRESAKAKPLRQPIYDVKYFTNKILFLSRVLILDFDVIALEFPAKPLGLAPPMCYKHDHPLLPVVFIGA